MGVPSLGEWVGFGLGTVFVLLFGWLGVRVLRQAVPTLRASLRRDEYEPVEARVLDADLAVEGGAKGPTYEPRIEYRYAVDGETYTSDSVYPGALTGTGNRSKEQSVVDAYSEGDRVRAYYDPSDPATAFLENESTAEDALFGILIGAVFVLFALGVAAWGVGALLEAFGADPSGVP